MVGGVPRCIPGMVGGVPRCIPGMMGDTYCTPWWVWWYASLLYTLVGMPPYVYPGGIPYYTPLGTPSSYACPAVHHSCRCSLPGERALGSRRENPLGEGFL